MTISIGTDIIEIERIKRVFERQGERIVKRILTPNEYERYVSIAHQDVQIAFLSKRWCAKEAISKALGTGIAKGIGWQQIEISNNELGAPHVQLFDAALNRLHEIGGVQVLLSISDECQYAIAYCTII